jgi:hypothetical protein
MERSPQDDLRDAVLRLNSRILGVTIGLMCGFSLFVSTNWLVLKGGPHVGAHLMLLGQYFPGYSVTFVGSLIGFIYAFILGYVIGSAVGHLYNRFAGI